MDWVNIASYEAAIMLSRTWHTSKKWAILVPHQDDASSLIPKFQGKCQEFLYLLQNIGNA